MFLYISHRPFATLSLSLRLVSNVQLDGFSCDQFGHLGWESWGGGVALLMMFAAKAFKLIDRREFKRSNLNDDMMIRKWDPVLTKVWRQRNPKGMQSFLASMIQTCSVTEASEEAKEGNEGLLEWAKEKAKKGAK
ncbi:hypothetical protein Tco_0941128 [Tanacetum coccineum]|uniref:Uncharacterized protein n=1 Tax=Tanacetum coccineum TaxID=301880 RepID=A0ABQ5DSK3_9ASTR